MAGLIEGNVIRNTIGYGGQIKYQNAWPDGLGLPTGPDRTIVRNNVFLKNDQESPDGDRPSFLVGAAGAGRVGGSSGSSGQAGAAGAAGSGAGTSPAGSAGTAAGAAGDTPSSGDSGGCGCRVVPESKPSWASALLGLGWAARRVRSSRGGRRRAG